MIQPFMSQTPLMVGVGNHEYDFNSTKIFAANGKDASGIAAPHGFMPAWGGTSTMTVVGSAAYQRPDDFECHNRVSVATGYFGIALI